MELDKTYKYAGIEEAQPDEAQTSERILPLRLANSQDRIKLEEQDQSYQHLSCTSPNLQRQNSQAVQKRN
jgi:hypothetical protein